MKNKEEQQEAIDSLLFKIGDEGFDYCFDGYSNWNEIEDKEFHELRAQYLAAKEELNDYIKDNFGDYEE